MAADRILMLKLLGDTSSMDKSLRKSEGRMKSFGRTVTRWGTAVVSDLAIQGFEKLTDTIGEAWTGFREGEKASAQLSTTWRNLGLDGSKLSGTIDAISRSTLKLGTDDTEAIMAYNRALQATGGRPKQAMDRLRIAQDLVANGSAPNLTSALGLIQQAAKGSARVVDRFGLKSGTAAGRVKELGDKVRGAARTAAKNDPFGVLENQIKEHMEGIVGAISKGELKDALAELEGIGTDVSAAWDKVGPAVTGALDKMTGGTFSDVLSKLQGLADKIVPAVRDSFTKLGEIWDALQPHVQNALDAIQPLVDMLGGAAEGTLGFVLDTVNGVLGTIADLLKGDFSGAFDTASTAAGDLASDLNDMFLGLPDKFFNEWIPDIAEAAGDLGNSIVTSAMTFISGLPGSVWDALVGDESIVTKLGEAVLTVGKKSAEVGQALLGGIVSAAKKLVVEVARIWNSLGGFGPGSFELFHGQTFDVFGQKLSIPPIGFSWGGGDIIPNIDVPALAKGGIATRPTLAMIGEAGPEAVVPLGRGGGMGGGATYNINVSVAPGGDLVEAGRQMVRAIQQYQRNGGAAHVKRAVSG